MDRERAATMRGVPRRFAVVVVAAAAFLTAGCIPPPEIPDLPDFPEAPGASAESGAPGGKEAVPGGKELTGGGQELAGGTALDVCAEVLPPAQVEQVVGEPVAAESITEDSCRYTGTGTDTLVRPEIALQVFGPMGGTPELWAEATEAGAGRVAGTTTERVDGLGDAAVLATHVAFSVVYVKAGGTVLTLTASLTGFTPSEDPDRTDEAALELARIALQRLP